MAKSSYKKTKTGFEYVGDLKECIAIAEAKVKRLQQDTPYIIRRFTEEEKRKTAHLKAISEATRFAKMAREQLAKEEAANGNT